MEPPADGHPVAADALLAPAAQEVLGHAFVDEGLLRQALTHRSAARGSASSSRAGSRARGRHGSARKAHRSEGSNERLEFIGDRVLGLLVAEWLLERHPTEQEGELGRRQARLVSQDVLAQVAERIGLPALLQVAPGEARAGVGLLATVLADALEAVIGALYLDGGLDAARHFVRRNWAPFVEALRVPPKDPKTRLQEWLLGRGQPLPDYRVAGQEGPPHAPVFVIEASGGGQAATGSGSSKRAAERAAATALLGALGA